MHIRTQIEILDEVDRHACFCKVRLSYVDVTRCMHAFLHINSPKQRFAVLPSRLKVVLLSPFYSLLSARFILVRVLSFIVLHV